MCMIEFVNLWNEKKTFEITSLSHQNEQRSCIPETEISPFTHLLSLLDLSRPLLRWDSLDTAKDEHQRELQQGHRAYLHSL